MTYFTKIYSIYFAHILQIFFIICCFLNYSCADNGKKEDFKIPRQVIYDPPNVYCSTLIYETKDSGRDYLKPISPNQDKDVYINIGANLFVLGNRLLHNDTLFDDFDIILKINDTLDKYLGNIIQSKISNRDSLWVKVSAKYRTGCGFDLIYEGLQNNNKFKLREDKHVSILIGSWFEFLNYQVIRLENNDIDAENFLLLERSIYSIIYHLKDDCESPISNLYIKELSKTHRLFKNAIIKDNSYVSVIGDSIKRCKFIYDNDKMPEIITKIKYLRNKYIGKKQISRKTTSAGLFAQ